MIRRIGMSGGMTPVMQKGNCVPKPFQLGRTWEELVGEQSSEPIPVDREFVVALFRVRK
jgi:hypothetical protein